MPCAGSGSRSGAQLPKQYMPVAGQPLIAHTLQALMQVQGVEAISVVIAPSDQLFGDYAPAGFQGIVTPTGGKTRAESVRAGLSALRAHGAADQDWVLVHDAARCLVLPEWVQMLIDACKDDDVGGLLAQPVPDTLKQGAAGRSVATVSRQDKWLAQTPQMFRIGLLEQALDDAEAKGLEVTDEASAVEALGLKPRLVACSADNFKLTYPQDFERAEAIFHMRHHLKKSGLYADAEKG